MDMDEYVDPFGKFSMKTLVEAFHQMDVDKNDHIGIQDLVALFNALGEKDVDEDLLNEILEMIDSSGDGQISIDEFMAFVIDNTSGDSTNKYVAKQMEYVQYLSREERHRVIVAEDDEMETKLGDNQVDAGFLRTLSHKFEMPTDVIESAKQFHLYASKYVFEAICDENRNISPAIIRYAFTKCNERALKKHYQDAVELNYLCKHLQIRKSSESHKLLEQFCNDEDGKMVPYRGLVLGFVLQIVEDNDDRVDFLYDIYDKDGSNAVEMKELLEMLFATNPMPPTEDGIEKIVKKAKFIMQQCDADCNGILDREEFHDLARKFPNLVFPKL